MGAVGWGVFSLLAWAGALVERPVQVLGNSLVTWWRMLVWSVGRNDESNSQLTEEDSMLLGQSGMLMLMVLVDDTSLRYVSARFFFSSNPEVLSQRIFVPDSWAKFCFCEGRESRLYFCLKASRFLWAWARLCSKLSSPWTCFASSPFFKLSLYRLFLFSSELKKNWIGFTSALAPAPILPAFTLGPKYLQSKFFELYSWHWSWLVEISNFDVFLPLSPWANP